MAVLCYSVHQYGSRQATRNDIFLTHKNTTQYGIRSFRNFGAKMWNDIPVGIKSSPSDISFRINLKSYNFDKSYKY